MSLYIKNIVSDTQVSTDIKCLIPDAGVRRRMSRVLKMAVSTAIECAGGYEGIDALDAIITATGYGCLADSEKFLRNIIADGEDLLNPTPFIQSTFNTVGGMIAMLRHNHCYNMTYVNRGHSFEDALLDAFMRAKDGEGKNMLVGAFDEKTPSQCRIMERMGVWRIGECGEGAVFMLATSEMTPDALAEVVLVDFPQQLMTEEECMAKYASSAESVLLFNEMDSCGLYPTASSAMFAKAIALIEDGAKEVIVYNALWNASPAVTVLRCI
jgi:hypothetical protein